MLAGAGNRLPGFLRHFRAISAIDEPPVCSGESSLLGQTYRIVISFSLGLDDLAVRFAYRRFLDSVHDGAKKNIKKIMAKTINKMRPETSPSLNIFASNTIRSQELIPVVPHMALERGFYPPSGNIGPRIS